MLMNGTRHIHKSSRGIMNKPSLTAAEQRQIDLAPTIGIMADNVMHLKRIQSGESEDAVKQRFWNERAKKDLLNQMDKSQAKIYASQFAETPEQKIARLKAELAEAEQKIAPPVIAGDEVTAADMNFDVFTTKAELEAYGRELRLPIELDKRETMANMTADLCAHIDEHGLAPELMQQEQEQEE